MNTLRYYLKIASRNKLMLFLYIVILLGITLPQGMSGGSIYEKTKINIGLVKEDDSVFANSFEEYLKENHYIHPYDTVEAGELDLYTGYIDGVIEIPKDSETILLKSTDPAINMIRDITNPRSHILGRIAEKYPLFYRSMVQTGTLDVKRLSEILNQGADVLSLKPQKDVEVQFFSFANAYGFVIMMILLKMLGDLNVSFNKKDIRIRSRIVPVSNAKIHAELSLAQILLSLIAFSLTTGTALIAIFPGMLNSESLLYYIFLMLLWTITIVFFSNLLNQLVRTKTLGDMIANALPIILMLLSGSSIPISMLPKFVQTLARFSPLYYYNQAIVKLSEKNYNLQNEILIVLAFGAAFYLTALYIGKEKKKAHE